MDKILRRVRMAERQVARRTKTRKERNDRREEKKRLIENRPHLGMTKFEARNAIIARREDLMLGPLAPRRDVSRKDAFGGYWGSISAERATFQLRITEEQRKARSAWAGGPQYLCLAVGDRVVITEGAYKGQISAISKIRKDMMVVELEGNVNIVNINIPKFVREEDRTLVQPSKTPIPISAVRLVHPIIDPVSGVARDVIIRELQPVGITHDRPTRKVFYSRIVPGLNVRIPWPKQEPKVHEDHPNDTLRLEVEERTFVPTLLRPPMPEVVLDELRNRYSKFRTRHTPEYIAEVERREAEKKARQKGARAGEMLLPVQEYNRKMRELRRARGQPELSEEMLAKIGEVIARNRAVRSAGKPAAAEGEVDQVQKAVEELSLGGDAQGTTAGEQPRA